MIFSEPRDPRLITIRRVGSLTDDHRHRLGRWAATWGEHVLHLFEEAQPSDSRPRHAIELARAWTRGEITMSEARAAAGHAMAAATELSGAARNSLPRARRRSLRDCHFTHRFWRFPKPMLPILLSKT